MIKSSGFWNSNSKYCFCSEPSKIENYDKAIADTTQVWVCHHRLETHTSDGERRPVDLTREELKALGMYYHRPSEEFIFLTKKGHSSLHKPSEEAKKKLSNSLKGHKCSKETKQKISNSLKGHVPPNKGKPMSDETKRKLSEKMSKMSWKIDPETGKRVYFKKEGMVHAALDRLYK